MNFKIITPETTQDLLAAIANNQDNNFRFGAGYTDLILELKKEPDNNLTVINLAQLNDEGFTGIEKVDDGLRIGALVTAARIANDKEILQRYPVLGIAANHLASRQIRQVATVGGNLCTASPAGDITCALMALQARCEILSARAVLKTVPIDNFFVDVRKTILGQDEVLRSILITPKSESKKIYSDFIKIGTRRSMECSVVSLAYHIQTDREDNIINAGIGIGSAAPTIKFVKSACQYLQDRNFSSISSSEREEFAHKVLQYARPISDIRASAWYRKEALFNISKSIFDK